MSSSLSGVDHSLSGSGTLSDERYDELVAFRRDLHMHPEISREEFRTTAAIWSRLEKAGLRPREVPCGTGLICDIGDADGPRLALRADIDALPLPDTKNVPYRSTEPGRAHACGHDVHTTCVLGAGLVLADLAREGRLATPVRLIFQPAEEIMPGGALDMVKADVLDGVGRILAVHCDPKVEVGRIGLRTGSITSACDRLELSMDGPGGHTARPHLTTDLVMATAKMATELPAVLARRIDPRGGLSLVWGRIESGHAPNVIPQHAELEGTVRCLDLAAWHEAPDLIHEIVDQISSMYRAKWEVTYQRGVPPVVNDADSAELLRDAMTARFGAHCVEDTEQSLGGEDFSWYLEHVPGALARLGVRPVGDPVVRDLHRGDFDADEQAIRVGAELFVQAVQLS
ncbi:MULTISPECIES: amidohydrolase [Streptomycetaceae]|uniref:M20/M25/M40 family peptidase n=1 Tax=Streptantibioticus cattleyicolor (strain ATCC 35852 / DSM 46488 / JCM 4925 / NBRC 14057 / NRRL 8057) TaxID=1003195 RepID=F8K166_STREN|nr:MULTISPECIES: amidohydrolase [Streptomycetaceae]AEW96137.1 M20/M25/M40 family peptidase [Streptantibioticus cattleyicolor NRRL 8057 = DSM 46488]MYS60665.1 amidohydrolase [Streptomyces sp. SID5468]CCB76475.1 putative M20/M25/M40-family peptidase [Streptantibioticus cattleyicolor NRRL 8057 = DSM 46488]